MARRMKRLGTNLSIDHHGQGILLIALGLFFAVRAWWSLLGLLLYCVMHFSYGGAGTFQRPPRANDNPDGIVDVVIVSLGLCGIGLMVFGLVWRAWQAWLA